MTIIQYGKNIECVGTLSHYCILYMYVLYEDYACKPQYIINIYISTKNLK